MNQVIFTAKENGILIGFVCAFGNHDETYGTYIDNLHVKTKGRGIGRQLMQHIFNWSIEKYQQPKVYLWVLEKNIAARAFYERVGGKCSEIKTVEHHGGGPVRACRYIWENVSG